MRYDTKQWKTPGVGKFKYLKRMISLFKMYPLYIVSYTHYIYHLCYPGEFDFTVKLT